MVDLSHDEGVAATGTIRSNSTPRHSTVHAVYYTYIYLHTYSLQPPFYRLPVHVRAFHPLSLSLSLLSTPFSLGRYIHIYRYTYWIYAICSMAVYNIHCNPLWLYPWCCGVWVYFFSDVKWCTYTHARIGNYVLRLWKYISNQWFSLKMMIGFWRL